jgi:hypothetical protein
MNYFPFSRSCVDWDIVTIVTGQIHPRDGPVLAIHTPLYPRRRVSSGRSRSPATCSRLRPLGRPHCIAIAGAGASQCAPRPMHPSSSSAALFHMDTHRRTCLPGGIGDADHAHTHESPSDVLPLWEGVPDQICLFVCSLSGDFSHISSKSPE